MIGGLTTLVEGEAEAMSALTGLRTCSNCGRTATVDNREDFTGDSALFSCDTCGQREEVLFRTVPVRVVEEVRIVEEPHIILGET